LHGSPLTCPKASAGKASTVSTSSGALASARTSSPFWPSGAVVQATRSCSPSASRSTPSVETKTRPAGAANFALPRVIVRGSLAGVAAVVAKGALVPVGDAVGALVTLDERLGLAEPTGAVGELDTA
jgi:hypothetical protein